jgi:hypothetical protein
MAAPAAFRLPDDPRFKPTRPVDDGTRPAHACRERRHQEMGMPKVPRWLRGSHKSFAQPQPATALAGVRRFLVAAYNTSVGPSKERMWMPLLDQERADHLVSWWAAIQNNRKAKLIDATVASANLKKVRLMCRWIKAMRAQRMTALRPLMLIDMNGP